MLRLLTTCCLILVAVCVVPRDDDAEFHFYGTAGSRDLDDVEDYHGDDDDTAAAASPNDLLNFDFNSVDDVLELEYLALFVDPSHGTCPNFHPAEIQFNDDSVMEEYGEVALNELQQEYQPVMSQIVNLWRDRGIPALHRLGLADPEATTNFDAEYTSGDDGTSTFNANDHAFHDGAFDPSPVKIVIDGVAFHAGERIGAGVAHHLSVEQLAAVNEILRNLGLSELGVTDADFTEGSKDFDGAHHSTDEGQERDTSVPPPMTTMDRLEARLRVEERERYMKEARPSTTPQTVKPEGSLSTEGVAAELERQRNEQEERARAAYDAENALWMMTQQAQTRVTSNDNAAFLSCDDLQPNKEHVAQVRNVLKAVEHSCHGGHHETDTPSWRRVLEMTSSRVAAAPLSPQTRALLSAEIERVSTVCGLRIRQEALDCSNAKQLVKLLQGSSSSPTGSRFTSPGDILGAMLAQKDAAVPDGVEPAPFLRRWMAAIESTELSSCLGSEADPALRGELSYIAFLMRMLISPAPGSSDEAHALLNLVSGNDHGSVNARLSLATMHEHGLVAGHDCLESTRLLLSASSRAHKHFYVSLEKAYGRADGTIDETRLRSAGRFFRVSGFHFTLLSEETTTTDRHTMAESFAAITEHFCATNSIAAAAELLHIIQSYFWRLRPRHPDADPPSTQSGDVDSAVQTEMHCWTMAVVARLFPVVVMPLWLHVTIRCPNNIQRVIRTELIKGGVPLGGDGGTLIATTTKWKNDRERTWVAEALEDLTFFSSTTHGLTFLALQLLLLPPDVSRAHDVLRQSAQVLDHLLTLTGLVFDEATKDLSLTADLDEEHPIAGMKWYRALAVVARFDHGGTDELGSVSSGFVRPEVPLLRGLVDHLRGQPLDAVKWLVKGAALELDDMESGHQILNAVMGGPLDMTKTARRGECLYLLARLVDTVPGLWTTWRTSNTVGFPLDVPGVSIFAYRDSQSFARALLDAAASGPIHHVPSILETLIGRWNRLVHSVAHEEPGMAGTVAAECAAILADARTAVTLIHEPRTLLAVQWSVDAWVGGCDHHVTNVDRLRRAVSEAISQLSSVPSWSSSSADARLPSWVSMGKLNDSRMHASRFLRAFTARDVGLAPTVMATEMLAFTLQQGSVEALSAAIELGELGLQRGAESCTRSATASSSSCAVFGDAMSNISRRLVVQFVSPALRVFQEERRRAAQSASRPMTLRYLGSPFVFLPAEMRLDLAEATLYHAALHEWRRGCVLVRVRAESSALRCTSPDEGGGVLQVLRVAESPWALGLKQWLCRVDPSSAEFTAVARHVDASVRLLAACGGVGLDESTSTARVLAMLVGEDPSPPPVASPRCWIALGSVLEAFVHNSGEGHDLGMLWWNVSIDAVFLAALAKTSTRVATLHAVFHEYQGYDDGTAGVESQFSSSGHPESTMLLSEEDPDEDDPDDTRLKQPSLDEVKRRSLRHPSHKAKQSIKPASLVDSHGRRQSGDGQWLFARRLTIVPSWFAAVWYEWVLAVARYVTIPW